MVQFIKKLFQNSVISYLFFGGCTTFVNLGIYYLLRYVTSLEITIINVISIFCAILFAYFTNAKYVFRSEVSGIQGKFREFLKFFTARLSTMVIEIAGVEVFVILGVDDRIGKLIIQFVVLALNYLFSKFLVFVKK